MNKIILYHVGLFEIKEPDVYHGRKNADFGQGFYLSNDLNFCLKWARFENDKVTYLNKYELDLNDLKIKSFEKDKECFKYINNNRNNYEDYLKDYDLIIGPISNDILYNTLGITTSGILNLDDSYKLFSIGDNLYNQYVIKTLKAKSNLKFIESKILKEEDLIKLKKELKKEEKKFQNLFFKTLNKMN